MGGEVDIEAISIRGKTDASLCRPWGGTYKSGPDANLRKNAKIEARDISDRTALRHAIRSGRKETVQALLRFRSGC